MIKNTLTILLILFCYNLFGQTFNSIWDTEQSGASAFNEITIPTNPAYVYNYTVDWGDSSIDNNVTGDITHTYTTSGRYTISISGNFPAIYFNDDGDKSKIIEILAWGDIQWQTTENAFYGCENLNFDAIDNPDLSQVTTLKNMFRSATSFNGIINNWDVSTITDISGMFYGASVFNRPLDTWNTSNVTDMSETFRNTSLYNEPLDNWNTALVTNMSSMFNGAGNFNQNINNWDVSQVTNMFSMFSSTSTFNQPLNSWNTSNVTDMSYMFQSSAFNQNIEGWDVSNVTNMSGMFRRNRVFNQPLNNWDVSNVTNMSSMFDGFYLSCVFNQPLNNWDVSSVTSMSNMFRDSRAFNQPLDSWDVSGVTNMSGMFENSNSFNQDISVWNVSGVTNMSGMFENSDSFNQNISIWDVSNVTNMESMFYSNDVFNQPLNSWNVSSVTNMGSMFYGTLVFNQPLNNWDVSNVTNMSSMFYRALVFNQPLNDWDVSNVTNMSRMFSTNGSNITAFNHPLNGWNVSSVTNMSNMFQNATTFNQNLGSWNVTNVSNMANMLSDSGLSQANYDNTLIGWATQSLRSNVSLGALNLNYCDGRFARQELIDNFNWDVTGDIVNCPFVFCTSLVSPIDGDTNVPANTNLMWEATPGATGYRISVRRVNGSVTQIIYNDEDVGNVIGVDFTSDLTPGDVVFVTIVPYNASGPATGCTEESFTVVESWVNSPDAFVLTYDTRIAETWSSDENQIEIEIRSGLSYNFSIDWGDNQFNNNVTSTITHTYNTPGIYTVTIIGDYPAHYFRNFFSDSRKVLSIDQWGTQQWQSMERSFYYCQNMTYNATDLPDLSQVTNMSEMFYNASLFNGDINSWDVSNVNDMESMFQGAGDFNQPLNSWDVSSVTNMASMFLGARSFNQPLDTWDVGNVTDMAGMFQYGIVFNQNINSWNVSNVTNMASMFRDAEAFNNPIENWDVSSVTNMEAMFYDAIAFNQLINSWNVETSQNMSYMFRNASSFNQPLNNWNVTSVNVMTSMFENATVFNQNIDSWNVTNVTNMEAMFRNAMAFNQPLNNWDVNSVVNMTSMFESAQAFNQPLDAWNVSAVATMSSMFKNALLFNHPISTWDVSSVTLMDSMFEDAEAFNNPIENWNIASVTTTEAMFKDAIAFNQPLGNWNTGEVLTMAEMFSGASVFNQNVDNWNVSFVRTMEAMFKDAVTYNQPMNSWNVASVTTMQQMFDGATAFDQPLYNWNVRGVTTMQEMFDGATAFDQTINNWRVSGVSNMDYMFRNATTFNQSLNQWNIGTVSMRSMFDNATSLDQEFSTWNVSNVSDMRNMLDNTALTRENYDTTLIAWSEQALTSGITLGAQGLVYCDALEERQSMIDTYSWSVIGDMLDCPIPECTQLVAPLNGATNVPVNTNLSWEPTLYARGYRLTVRTNPGNVTIVNNETVTDTSYEFATDFSGGETVFVTLIPFNSEGDATACIEESFQVSSSATPTVPECTNLTLPVNGSTDIAVDSDLEWLAIANADGYRITAGTTLGNNDLIDNVDVGNVTTYDLPVNLPEDTTIFVTITPYNTVGDAASCTEESFTTELIPVPPTCTSLTNPLNGATDVPVNADLSWNPISNATSYLLTVGTTGGGIEILNSIDVGNVTTYNLSDDLPPNRLIFVTITPYNAVGDATSCSEESFRTGNSLAVIPNCTTLSMPLNNTTDVALDSNLDWNAVANATGYRISLGTTAGGTNIVNDQDVGNVTTFNPATDLPENTTIFVTITPYNAVGDATGCTEESFITETIATVPSCATLSSPLNNATDVALDSNLDWNAVASATGYRIDVGTTAGGTDVVNGQDVGNVTTFDPTADLPENTTIFVTITPYNAVGDATGCTEESFTTETIATVPNCTTLSSPLNNATDVALDSNLDWNVVASATGYRINVGTTAGGTDIVNGQDVGNVTTFNPTADLPENTTVFVTITPYNAVGDATGCPEESFTTETIATVPNCTTLSSPLNNTTDVALDSNLDWNAVASATGYRINIGTTAGGTDIVNGQDVGNVTTFNPATDLPENTTIFVTITPYNAVGDATGCTEESFTTETIATVPSCATLSSPLNNATDVALDSNLDWNAVASATGYRISLGTTAGGTDVVNSQDVGNVTTFDPTADLPENTTVFVTITPYNAVGDATGCTGESFTTETIATVPSCTSLTSPLNGDRDIVINTSLNWDAVPDATGYRINVGTLSGATDILNSEDVDNLLTFGLSDLPEGTTIYVTIIPYNAVGDAIGCSEESFTTEPLVESKYGFSPNGDGINDFWEIRGIENSPQNTVNIYNRWGDLVFSIPNYNNTTNVFRGEANNLTNLGASTLPDGTYFFDIKILGTHNLKKLKGFLVLKR